MCIHLPAKSSVEPVLEFFHHVSAERVLFIQSDDEKTCTDFVQDIVDTLKGAKVPAAANVIKLDAESLLSADVHGIAAMNFKSAINRVAAKKNGGIVHISNFNEAASTRPNASEVVAQLCSHLGNKKVRFIVSGDTQSVHASFINPNFALARRSVALTVA